MTMTALWGTSGRPGNTRRLFCTLLAIVAPSLADGQQQYTLRSVGNCDGTGFIDNINECNAAARTLGAAVSDTSASDLNTQSCWENLSPYGCYFRSTSSANNQLWWNRCGDTNDDDTGRVSICREPRLLPPSPSTSLAPPLSPLSLPVSGLQSLKGTRGQKRIETLDFPPARFLLLQAPPRLWGRSTGSGPSATAPPPDSPGSPVLWTAPRRRQRSGCMTPRPPSCMMTPCRVAACTSV